MGFKPSEEVLEKYAKVLINFALGNGEGVKPEEVIFVQIPESAKPFYAPLRNTILKSGAHPIMIYNPEDVRANDYYNIADDKQLEYFPDKYYRGIIDQIDHSIFIIAESNKYELKDVDPKKIIRRSQALRPYKEWREEKELKGKFTWTLGLYGTPEMAQDVNMDLQEYWEQIILACYLDKEDPILTWRQTYAEIGRIQEILNRLDIDYLDIEGDGINLEVGIGPARKWLSGSGRNVPSFEIFTSPDFRRIEGEVNFNQPVYAMGSVIKGISLVFKGGEMVQAKAQENQKLLDEIISTPGGKHIGEISLTDHKFSRITRVMGETLYDENIGGPNGNIHLALGSAYKETYEGVATPGNEDEWLSLGYNQSSIHVDIISTSKRTVTAHLKGGSEIIIYEKGSFTL